jgi:SEC-C motif-containing protein
MTTCPCGSGAAYDDCCRPLHRGGAAASAQALMRSRFSAFALADGAYLHRTWHPDTRPSRVTLDPRQQWVRLEILAVERGRFLDPAGTVEFRAHYRQAGRPGVLHERSRFVTVAGRWHYLDGQPR